VTINSGKDGAKNIQSQRELDILLKKWEPVYRLFADDIFLHPFSLPRLILKGWQHLPKLRGTVAPEISHLFSDEAVRAAISGLLLYAGVPPQKTPVQSILGLVGMLTDGYSIGIIQPGQCVQPCHQHPANDG
jgi:phytoene desaturase